MIIIKDLNNIKEENFNLSQEDKLIIYKLCCKLERLEDIKDTLKDGLDVEECSIHFEIN
jgi:hypothetical protein